MKITDELENWIVRKNGSGLCKRYAYDIMQNRIKRAQNVYTKMRQIHSIFADLEIDCKEIGIESPISSAEISLWCKDIHNKAHQKEEEFTKCVNRGERILQIKELNDN